jgi:hypothetical protein
VILDVRRLTARHIRDGGVVLWDAHFNRPVTVSRHSNKTDPCHPKCRVVTDPVPENTLDAPHLKILLGEVEQAARFVEGSGTHALRFSYRVQPEDPPSSIQLKPGKLHLGDSWFLHDDLGEVVQREIPVHVLKSDHSQAHIDLLTPGMDPKQRVPFALRIKPSVPQDIRAWRVRLSGWDDHGIVAYALSPHPEPPELGSPDWIKVEERNRLDVRTMYQLPRNQPIPTMLALHAWLRDEAGNLSARISERVRLDFRKPAPQDMDGPQGFVQLASGKERASGDKVLLILNAEDPQGVSGYYISESRVRPEPYEFKLINPPEPKFKQLVAVPLGDVEGPRTLHVWFRDTAGTADRRLVERKVWSTGNHVFWKRALPCWSRLTKTGSMATTSVGVRRFHPSRSLRLAHPRSVSALQRRSALKAVFQATDSSPSSVTFSAASPVLWSWVWFPSSGAPSTSSPIRRPQTHAPSRSVKRPMPSGPKLTSAVAIFLIITCGYGLFYVWSHYDDLRETQVRRQMEMLNARE